MSRHQLTDQDISEAISMVTSSINDRLKQKGKGIFVSSHEIMGILTEEYQEYCAEIHNKNPINQFSELVDIAVACIIGMASMGTKKMDWHNGN